MMTHGSVRASLTRPFEGRMNSRPHPHAEDTGGGEREGIESRDVPGPSPRRTVLFEPMECRVTGGSDPCLALHPETGHGKLGVRNGREPTSTSR